LKRLISLAYGFSEDRIILPDRRSRDRYDVLLKTPRDTFSDSKLLLKPAIEHAFNLRVSTAIRPTEVYVMTIDRAGTRNLRPASTASSRIWRDGNVLTAVSATAGSLADSVASIIGKPVVDETGMEGRYDFMVDIGDGNPGRAISALETQLGFKFQLASRPREVLIVKDPVCLRAMPCAGERG